MRRSRCWHNGLFVLPLHQRHLRSPFPSAIIVRSYFFSSGDRCAESLVKNMNFSWGSGSGWLMQIWKVTFVFMYVEPRKDKLVSWAQKLNINKHFWSELLTGVSNGPQVNASEHFYSSFQGNPSWPCSADSSQISYISLMIVYPIVPNLDSELIVDEGFAH